MKSSSIFWACLFGISDAFLQLDVHGQPRSYADTLRDRSPLLKRQYGMHVGESVMAIEPWYYGGAFYMNVSVGTPGQVVTVALDTVSSVTYFDVQDSTQCQETSTYGLNYRPCAGGFFQTNFSSTYRVDTPDGFNYTTFGTVTASGDLGIDVVHVGQVEIRDMPFGAAKNNIYEAGLIGLGYGLNEGTEMVNPSRTFLETMKKSGAIRSSLYSVLLSDKGTATGSIVFGGVNLYAFTGDLVTLNFLPATVDWQGNSISDGQSLISAVTQPMIAITDIGYTFGNGSQVSIYADGDPLGQSNTSLPTNLGFTDGWWSVSTEVYNQITPLIPGLNTTSGIVPCDAADQQTNITVTFTGAVTLDVPLGNMIVPLFNARTNIQNTTSEGQPLCMFAMYARNGSSQDPYYLGGSAMRSMYFVFDLDNAQVSVAQVDHSQRGSAQDVPAGPSGLARILESMSYTTTTMVTASPNSAFDLAVVTATNSLESVTPVAHTTSAGIGTATGTAAIPTNGVVENQSVLSSGSLTSRPTPVSPASSGTANANSTSTQGSGARRNRLSDFCLSVLADTNAPLLILGISFVFLGLVIAV